MKKYLITLVLIPFLLGVSPQDNERERALRYTAGAILKDPLAASILSKRQSAIYKAFSDGAQLRRSLGIEFRKLEPAEAESLGVDKDSFIVMQAFEGSAAQKQGLKLGQVITAVNGKKYETLDAMLGELLSSLKGGVVLLTLDDTKQEKIFYSDYDLALSAVVYYLDRSRYYEEKGDLSRALKNLDDALIIYPDNKTNKEKKERLLKLLKVNSKD